MLNQFYFECCLPELLDPRIKMPIRELAYITEAIKEMETLKKRIKLSSTDEREIKDDFRKKRK